MEQVSPRDTAFVFSSLYFNSLYFIHSPSLARSYALDIVCLLTCLLVFCFCCYLVQLSSLIVLPFFNLDNWFHFICLLYGFFAIVRHTSFHARWHSSIGCPAEFLVSYISKLSSSVSNDFALSLSLVCCFLFALRLFR